jgi:hypothetical protein
MSEYIPSIEAEAFAKHPEILEALYFWADGLIGDQSLIGKLSAIQFISNRELARQLERKDMGLDS